MKKYHVSVVNAAGEKGKRKKKIERLAACMQAKGHHTYHSRVCSHDACVLMNSTSASIRRASPVYPTRVVVVGKLARRIRYCCCCRRLSQLHQLEHPVREQPVAVGSADIEAMLVLGQGFAVIDRNSGVIKNFFYTESVELHPTWNPVRNTEESATALPQAHPQNPRILKHNELYLRKVRA